MSVDTLLGLLALLMVLFGAFVIIMMYFKYKEW